MEPVKKVTIKELEEAAYPLVALPFNGQQFFFSLRVLNDTQIRAIGDFCIIDIRTEEEKEQNKESKTNDLDYLIDTKNVQEKLCEAVMVSPTFKEVQEIVYGTDKGLKEKLDKIKKLSDLIKTLPISEQTTYIKEMESLELFTGYLLPTDFMGALTNWVLQVDKSDIKKITREMLFEAAILAEKGKDNPSEHMIGVFNDFHKKEIDKSAWIVYQQFVNDKQKEQELKKMYKGYTFIRGKSKKG